MLCRIKMRLRLPQLPQLSAVSPREFRGYALTRSQQACDRRLVDTGNTLASLCPALNEAKATTGKRKRAAVPVTIPRLRPFIVQFSRECVAVYFALLQLRYGWKCGRKCVAKTKTGTGVVLNRGGVMITSTRYFFNTFNYPRIIPLLLQN